VGVYRELSIEEIKDINAVVNINSELITKNTEEIAALLDEQTKTNALL